MTETKAFVPLPRKIDFPPLLHKLLKKYQERRHMEAVQHVRDACKALSETVKRVTKSDSQKEIGDCHSMDRFYRDFRAIITKSVNCIVWILPVKIPKHRILNICTTFQVWLDEEIQYATLLEIPSLIAEMDQPTQDIFENIASKHNAAVIAYENQFALPSTPRTPFKHFLTVQTPIWREENKHREMRRGSKTNMLTELYEMKLPRAQHEEFIQSALQELEAYPKTFQSWIEFWQRVHTKQFDEE